MNWEATKAELERDEGLRLKPYKDSLGFLTVGIGRNLDGRGITQEEALYLFRNDLRLAYAECLDRITVFPYLDDDRQGVLVNMMFNLGWPKLSQFHKFLKALGLQDFVGAALEMEDSRWYDQVGDRAKRLVKRMRGV